MLCHLYQKRDVTPDAEKNNEKYLRGSYIDDLIGTMVNDRLAELRQQTQPPYQSATGRASTFFLSRMKESFSLSVSCKENNILGGLIAAVGVAERIRQHGFTQSELNIAKGLKLNHDERKFRERDDRRNSKYVSACIQHFLNNEPLLSAEQQLELTRRFDREVTLAEVNAAVRELITDKNQVAILYAPDKEGLVLPTEEQIEDVILAAQQLSYAPYEEKQLADKLIEQLPKAGSIVSEKAYKHGFKEWTLSNGMKVYVKKTDYAADAVSFRMQAEGGTSVFSNEEAPNFALLNSAITDAGVGQFDATTLRRMLSGKSVRVQPSVNTRGQSISGGVSLKDMPTLFELVHLYFTQPRRDTVAFASLINRTHAFLTNRNASPKVDYNDSIRAILYDHHPRLAPVVQATLDKVNYDRILEIYRHAFSDASNFKTVIIGNYDEQELRRLCCQYLASLPSTGKHEQINWQNVPKMIEGSSVNRFTKKMSTPLANVSIFYSADVPFTPQSDLELDFLKRCLRERRL